MVHLVCLLSFTYLLFASYWGDQQFAGPEKLCNHQPSVINQYSSSSIIPSLNYTITSLYHHLSSIPSSSIHHLSSLYHHYSIISRCSQRLRRRARHRRTRPLRHRCRHRAVKAGHQQLAVHEHEAQVISGDMAMPVFTDRKTQLMWVNMVINGWFMVIIDH